MCQTPCVKSEVPDTDFLIRNKVCFSGLAEYQFKKTEKISRNVWQLECGAVSHLLVTVVSHVPCAHCLVLLHVTSGFYGFVPF